MMMCVCELEEEHIALLGDVQEALEQKTTCNIAIDEVCLQECEGVIAKRHEEHSISVRFPWKRRLVTGGMRGIRLP